MYIWDTPGSYLAHPLLVPLGAARHHSHLRGRMDHSGEVVWCLWNISNSSYAKQYCKISKILRLDCFAQRWNQLISFSQPVKHGFSMVFPISLIVFTLLPSNLSYPFQPPNATFRTPPTNPTGTSPWSVVPQPEASGPGGLENHHPNRYTHCPSRTWRHYV